MKILATVKFLYTHCKESLHFYKTIKLYFIDYYQVAILAQSMLWDTRLIVTLYHYEQLFEVFK